MAYGWDDPSGDPFGDAGSKQPDIDVVDLTGVDEVKLEHPKRVMPPVNKSIRNYKLDGDHRSVKQVAVHGNTYRVGDFVELRQLVGTYNIQFIEIKSISLHNETNNVIVRGLPYARARNLGGCLPKKWNEVCLILEVDANDARPDEQQALLQIEPEQILKKRILTNTNRPFPDCRFDPVVYATDEQKEQKAPLACRWTMRAEYKDASQRRAGRLQGQRLEHLSEHDSHKIKWRNLGLDKHRSRAWRGETIPGGSTIKGENENENENDDSLKQVQKYSFADISAGAGGASRGAQMAGLDVVLATESCLHACNSYQANFPTTNTELYQIEPTELVAGEEKCAVDILYISPSALSVVGDETAAALVATGLLKKFLPRVVVIEQPATITSKKNAPSFNKAIILSLTQAGYSIQWRQVNMADYGLPQPQMRKRVILIGAGPGEKLPSWPPVTHGSDGLGNRKPFVTEEEAISGLNSQLHSLHNPKALPVIDGKREFTLRELASLQGFPTYHEFKGAYIKKQISTAFPPSVAMEFFQHLRLHLEDVDGGSGSSGGPDSPGAPGAHPSPAGHPEISMPGENTTNGAGSPGRPETPSAPRTRFEQIAGPEALLPTPPPTQQLPTPSTSTGRFIAGERAAALRRRRDRAAFEGDGDDGGDKGSGPGNSQTPSKRPRTSAGSIETRSDTSRTISVSPDVEHAGGQEDSSLYDDDEIPEMDWDMRSEDYDGEV